MKFEIRERFTLEPWQDEAVSAWLGVNDSRLGPRHGILDIYTGAGKTVVALGAMAVVSAETPAMKFAVVVPTIALGEQWVAAVSERTTLPAARIGMVGGEHNDSFARKDVVVYVIASARPSQGERSRLARDVDGHEVMLVVDECHKAGAPSSSRIFDATTTCRLGLSATPLREGADSQDDLGQVLPLGHQRHGRALGKVCFRLGLRDGYERGMLPRYEIHHHGISLTRKEQDEYSLLTHRVSEARKGVSRSGDSSTPQWLALGCLTEAPTWDGQGEPPAERAVSTSVDSSAPPEEAATRSPKAPPATRSKSGKEPWFVLVQEGFLAATRDDAATLAAITESLRHASKAWAYEAMSALAEGTKLTEGSDEKPPSQLDTLLPFVASAYSSGRTDLIELAAEGFRVGKAEKPQRVAVHNALAILAGHTQEIWRSE